VKITTIDLVVQDCRALISSMLSVSVMFVRREQNIGAHNLASLAKVVGNRTWIGVAPNMSGIPNYVKLVLFVFHMVVCQLLSNELKI
jgi:hypothetical protein